MTISILGIAQETRNTTGANSACSNRKSGKNKYSSGQKLLVMTRKK